MLLTQKQVKQLKERYPHDDVQTAFARAAEAALRDEELMEKAIAAQEWKKLRKPFFCLAMMIFLLWVITGK